MTGEFLANLIFCRLKTNNLYALRYLFCEVLNFVNTICQIYLTDVFLGTDEPAKFYRFISGYDK